MLGSGRAGANGLMESPDLRRVERAAGVAHEHGAGHLESGHGLIAAFDYGGGAAGDDLAALQQFLDVGMVLELLEGLEGFEARIFIVQADHEPDVHPIVVEVVQKAAAIGVGIERPAQGMLNQSGLNTAGRQLPQLLESQAIGLRRLAGVELEALDELLGDAAAAALAEHGDLGVNLGPQSKIRSRLAVLFDSHVAYAHALDGAGLVEQSLSRRESREYVHSQLFRLLAENRDDVSQRNDEVAVIRHLRRGRAAIALAAGHE